MKQVRTNRKQVRANKKQDGPNRKQVRANRKWVRTNRKQVRTNRKQVRTNRKQVGPHCKQDGPNRKQVRANRIRLEQIGNRLEQIGNTLDQIGNSEVWEKSIELSTGVQQLYRYCVVVLLQHGRIIVRRWETHLQPRRVTEETPCDEFGKINGLVSIQRGWLTEEMVIQFKLRESGINIWKRKFAGHRLWIKLTPVNHEEVVEIHETDESMDVAELRERFINYPIVETAELSEEGCVRKVQEQFGIELKTEQDTFVLFEVQLINLNSVAFLVDVYGRGENDVGPIPDHIGMCYIYSDTLRQTSGKIENTITSMKHQPIGRLQVDYLCIRPVEGLPCDFSTSNKTEWLEHWRSLDVGHRGLGNSYTTAQHCSNIRENTIASMKDAVLHGADMVEFDVQVSSDLVPIIYHEFTLCIQSKTKQEDADILLDIPVKDLTVNQLHGLKVHHPHEKSTGVKTFQENDKEHEPFPTLETALNLLDSDCGFNIEIKFSQLFKDGREEQKDMMEMNLFIDQVLKTVYQHAGERKIVFSSFNPDACSMLVNKQNLYPVLLLTQGRTSRYEDYLDPRTRSIPAAVWFCKMVGLLGISARADEVIKNPGHIDLVKSQGQILFTWTDDRNDKETVEHLKTLGIHGVIYDRMDQNNTKQVKESFFLQERRKGGKSDSGFSSDSSPASSPVSSATVL
ncbi:glycerophosphocholine phosphodiesterase GPCPD1 isoform X2 [Eurytemora carolleeae]|uniref:glycerophosphocholine phosphodiesterase GPCPD1 isoform X2 n=1 Tax=Eurytemora carolleeae TaxID=1294199 RepID=UPI000C76CA2C|nr:glycerophosphocholine phosphodiesterase GPCPD1 isoform X2 [Eurytemora carolleeae]|eukprot:XP_023327915.1 glycerophosphocholine phosphodiesterase GPCPD1-like isoform X2 [Eurytemora affinis]